MPEDFPYYNTVDQIFHATWTARKLARLELVRRWVRQLFPQGIETRLIQVGGTSGKGSVVRYLEAGLALAGSTAAMSSPHIFDYRERYRVNGEAASPEAITALWEGRLLPLCVEEALRGEWYVPSFHEMMILLTLSLCELHHVRWAAIEVGIGGRYDQTTALDYAATALTTVGRDHQRLLGKETWQRALDKAGICRADVPCFTTVQGEEVTRIVAAMAKHAAAPLHRVSEAAVRSVRAQVKALLPDGFAPDALLNAEHQYWNAALALAVIEQLEPDLDRAAVLRAFTEVRFEGRFQKIGRGIYADVAHNADKVAALVQEISTRIPGAARLIFVVALSGERQAAEVFPPIMDVADVVIVTASPRHGVSPFQVAEDLRSIDRYGVEVIVEPHPPQAYRLAQGMQGDDDVIILTGSTYMLDAALNPDPYLQMLNATHGWRDEIVPLT